MKRSLSLALFGCCLLWMTGCDRVPKKLDYEGTAYTRAIKRGYGSMRKIHIFVPKGKTPQNAKHSVNIIESSVKFDKKTLAKVETRMRIQLKRFKAKPYKGNKRQYCYFQKHRRQTILVHTLLHSVKTSAHLIQRTQKLNEQQRQQGPETLCEDSDTVFSELTRIAQSIFG